MNFSAAKALTAVKPFVLPIITATVCLFVGALLTVFTVRQIKRQIRLYNSIKLVELKSFKWHYYAFIFLIALFEFYVITQMADPEGPEVELMYKTLSMKRWQANLTLGFVAGLLVCVEFFLITVSFSRSAVVDKGVYYGVSYLSWYYVHDYIIDEENGKVVLSADKNTFATLKGTTPPLGVAKNDIPKLKFILNKNKNKFSA